MLWKAKNIDFLTYQNILVLGPSTDTDSTLQVNMEKHFIGELNDLGYTAESALQKFGLNAFQNMSVSHINKNLKNTNVTALVTIVLLKKQKGVMFVSGTFSLSPSALYSNNYNDYDYDKGWKNMIYDPGYYVNYADYTWISNVYDISSGKLAYSVQSHFNNVVNTQMMAHEYGQSIVKYMQKHKMLRNKKLLKPF